MEDPDDSPVSEIFGEAIIQYHRSKTRSQMIEFVAYIFSGLQALSSIPFLALAYTERSWDFLGIGIGIILAACLSFVVISWFAQLLRNSAELLRLGAFDFYNTFDDDDDETED